MRICSAVLVLACVVAAARGQGGIFDVGGKRAARAVVTFGDELPALSEHESGMTRLLAGVAADVRGKELASLRECAPPNPFLGDPTGAERVAVVHVFAGPKDAPKRVQIVRTPDDAYVAVELVESGRIAARAELDRVATRAMVMSWARYRGGFDESACVDPRGQTFEVPKPYATGWFYMDKGTIDGRFLGRPMFAIEGTDRTLANETLHARLPRGYDPRTPAGLLIWVNAGDTGQPPGVFAPVLDELGIICIGAANSGNARHIASRYQLAFDALATASGRWHIDPQRVYITGISGGGRVSSILQGCFPDVFAGAVPIVGMHYCEKVPNGLGQYWRPGYNRPSGAMFRLLRERPIAPITGRKDGNYVEMTNAADLMRRDGLDVKFFGDPGMGHEMPAADQFTEAMRWVDRVWRRTRDEETGAAAKAMETYVQRFGEGGRRLRSHAGCSSR